MNKRVLQLSILIIFLFLLCIGCGNKDDGENADPTQTVYETPEPAEPEAARDSMGNPYDVIITPAGCVVESDYLQIELPEYWEGKFLYAVSEDRTVIFYHRASYEYFKEYGKKDEQNTVSVNDMGILGWICYDDLETAVETLDAVGGEILGKTIPTDDGVYAYYSYRASDVRFPMEEKEITEEYTQLVEGWRGMTEGVVIKNAGTGADEIYDSIGNLYDRVITPFGLVVETDYLELELPETWRNKFLYAVSEDRTIILYHRASYEYFRGLGMTAADAASDLGDLGVIGWIGYGEVSEVEFAGEEIGGIHIFGEPVETDEGSFVYYLQVPTDVRFPLEEEAIVEEYDRFSFYFQENPDDYWNRRMSDYITIKE